MKRYQHHLSLPQIGLTGQEKLKAARVLVVGAGGLGSPVLLYLVAAGIGTIGIVENDQLELSNLQRQILYREDQVGAAKITLAQQTLAALNTDVRIEIHPTRLTADNAFELITNYDLVADCSDNFTTHYLINDACFYLNKPFVQATIAQFQGQCLVYTPTHACYRCLFPSPAFDSLDCEEAGVLGVLPGILGTLQANEIIKLILSIGQSLAGSLLTVDALNLTFQQLRLTIDPQCLLCQQPIPFQNLPRHEAFCETAGIDAAELYKHLQQNEVMQLIDVREPEEYERYAISTSRNIRLNSLPEHFSTLNKNTPLIVICERGKRSAQATNLLKQAGFSSVVHLRGGIQTWIQAGYPI